MNNSYEPDARQKLVDILIEEFHREYDPKNCRWDYTTFMLKSGRWNWDGENIIEVSTGRIIN